MKFRNVSFTFLILVSLCLAQEKSAEKAKPSLGGPAPKITGLTWIKGGPVQIKKGSVYVIEFWATWCPPCKYTIPHLTELQKKYKDKAVTIIGISNELVSTVQPFVKAKAETMDYIIAVDTDGIATKNYMRAFGETGIPTAFIIDKKGRLVWKGHPMADLDDVLEKVVEDKFDFEQYQKKLAEAKEKYERAVKNYMDYFEKINTASPKDVESIGSRIIQDADAQILNAFAWQILTKVEKPKRDYRLAVQAAEKANLLTEQKNPEVLDTYALALFESALYRIQQAVQLQQKAVILTADYPATQEKLKKTLEKYNSAAEKIAETKNTTD